MANFHFDLVSPEKLLYAGDVEQVDLPGSEGDMGVLADHAPLVTTLRPGIIVVHREGGDMRVVVNQGHRGGRRRLDRRLAARQARPPPAATASAAGGAVCLSGSGE